MSTTIKSIQDIMRKDVGVDGDAQRWPRFVGQLGECNRLRFAPIRMPGNIGDDVHIRCRLHDHPSGFQGSGERSGARTIGTKGQLGMHGGRNYDLPVETPEQVEVPDSRQGNEGSRIRDDRPGHEAVPTSSSNSSAG